MHVRHDIEIEIERLVRERDLPAILEWLAFLEKEKKQGINSGACRLNVLNEQGMSLLHVALSSERLIFEAESSVKEGSENPPVYLPEPIIEWLFDQLKNDDILLRLDQQGRSLIWLAAKSNRTEFGLMLIQHQLTQFATHERKETWLRADANGVTPLHEAAKWPASDFFRFLATQKNINAITSDHDTALHFACQEEEFENIAILINHGADIYFSNKKGENFFSYYENFTEEKKIALFRMLQNESQLAILHYYRKQLADEKISEEKYNVLDALYAKLVAQRVNRPRSLQELILSKMPYDPKAKFPLIAGLPDEALQMVPEYGDRVRAADRKHFGKSGIMAWLKSLFVKSSSHKGKPKKAPKSFTAKSTNEILEADRSRVQQLLIKTQAYTTKLIAQPVPLLNPFSIALRFYRILFGGLGVVIASLWLGWCALLLFVLIAATIVDPTHLSIALVLPFASYILSLISSLGGTMAFANWLAFGVSLAGGIAGMLFSTKVILPGSMEVFISPKETALLAKELEQDVLNKLESLNQQDKALLPETDYKELKEAVATIKKANISNSLMQQKVKKVEDHLKTLHEMMSTERKPLSVIHVPEEKKPSEWQERERIAAIAMKTALVACSLKAQDVLNKLEILNQQDKALLPETEAAAAVAACALKAQVVLNKLEILNQQGKALLPEADYQELKEAIATIKRENISIPQMQLKIKKAVDHLEALHEIISTEGKLLSSISVPEEKTPTVELPVRERVVAVAAPASLVTHTQVVASTPSSPIMPAAPAVAPPLSSASPTLKPAAQVAPWASLQKMQPKPEAVSPASSNPVRPRTFGRGSHA